MGRQLHQGVFVFCPWSKVDFPMVNMHFDAGQFEIGCGYVVIIVPVILDIELSLCHVKGENCSNDIKESRFSNFRHIKHQRDKQIAFAYFVDI